MKKPLYLDSARSARERAQDLVSHMTLEEMASQTVYNAPAIPRLGIKAYNWWNEALHGVARAGVATVFPQAIGLAATFDEDLIEAVACVISDEARAKFNLHQAYGDIDAYKGLTLWSPNVNIFRDPRWGRGHETYGEDPYLTARMGVRFILGLQGRDREHLKCAACAKHFAVHSGPEDLRHGFDAQVSGRDLWETYLPAFEACVHEAGVEAVMGAYNRVNGEPCCGSKTLLADILRGRWEFDGHVVSDCWAIKDFHLNHRVTGDALESAALALNSGCDLNCGVAYLNLLQAHRQGLVSEEAIKESAVRLMTTRFRLGLFDEPESPRFAGYGLETLYEEAHARLNESAAAKSIVLLKNDGVLPLDLSRINAIGVIGPNANNRKALIGNYEGTAIRYVTVLEGLQDCVGARARVLYSEGCHLFDDRLQRISRAGYNDRLSEALAVAEKSDVVVLCVGLDAGLEGEEGDPKNAFPSGDKPGLELPGRQIELIQKVLDTGKPVVLLNISGSAVTFGGNESRAAAVLQAFYPGALGGRAIVSVLLGDANPEGKLPVTFYRSAEELPEFIDYRMENRTYRYMKNEALYPFGFGLSYTSFELSDFMCEGDVGGQVALSVAIQNTGALAGGQTVQVYVQALADDAPNWQLRGLKKVFLEPGERKTVAFSLGHDDFAPCDESGRRALEDCEYRVFVGLSQPDARSVELLGTEPLMRKFFRR